MTALGLKYDKMKELSRTKFDPWRATCSLEEFHDDIAPLADFAFDLEKIGRPFKLPPETGFGFNTYFGFPVKDITNMGMDTNNLDLENIFDCLRYDTLIFNHYVTPSEMIDYYLYLNSGCSFIEAGLKWSNGATKLPVAINRDIFKLLIRLDYLKFLIVRFEMAGIKTCKRIVEDKIWTYERKQMDIYRKYVQNKKENVLIFKEYLLKNVGGFIDSTFMSGNGDQSYRPTDDEVIEHEKEFKEWEPTDMEIDDLNEDVERLKLPPMDLNKLKKDKVRNNNNNNNNSIEDFLKDESDDDVDMIEFV